MLLMNIWKHFEMNAMKLHFRIIQEKQGKDKPERGQRWKTKIQGAREKIFRKFKNNLKT